VQTCWLGGACVRLGVSGCIAELTVDPAHQPLRPIQSRPMSKKQSVYQPRPDNGGDARTNLPYDKPIDKEDYKHNLEVLSVELLKAQRHIKAVPDSAW